MVITRDSVRGAGGLFLKKNRLYPVCPCPAQKNQAVTMRVRVLHVHTSGLLARVVAVFNYVEFFKAALRRPGGR
jgi:hypothetical protein